MKAYGTCHAKSGSVASRNYFVVNNIATPTGIQNQEGTSWTTAFPSLLDAITKAYEYAARYTGITTVYIDLDTAATHYISRSNLYDFYQPQYKDFEIYQNVNLIIRTTGGIATIVNKRRDTW